MIRFIVSGWLVVMHTYLYYTFGCSCDTPTYLRIITLSVLAYRTLLLDQLITLTLGDRVSEYRF